MQTQLTNSLVQVKIVENQGEADLAKARKAAEAELAKAQKAAEQMIVTANAELERSRKQAEQMVVTARAEAEQRQLAGRGEASRIAQVGLSEAAVLLRKVQSFADPRLYALTQTVAHLSQSKQPLVPERVFMAGTNGHSSSSSGDVPIPDTSAQGLFGLLLSLMVAEKSGFSVADAGTASLAEYAEKITREAIDAPVAAPAATLGDASPAVAGPPVAGPAAKPAKAGSK
jgi:hypothetical protein